MMKKYKQFITGLILGALLFNISFVSAAIEEFVLKRSDYKLNLNMNAYQDNELPILDYKGNTYIPLRTLDILGIPNNINMSTKQIDIVYSRNTNSPIENKINETTDGISVEYYDGKPYVSLDNIKSKYDGYFEFTYSAILFSEELSKLPALKQKIYDENTLAISEKTVLENIPVTPISVFNGKAKFLYVDYSYYIKTILPIISKSLSNKIENTPDGIPVIYYRYKNYVRPSIIEKKYTPLNCKFLKHSNNDLYGLYLNNKLVLDNINIDNRNIYQEAIPYEYYIEKILPLLQK